MVSIEMPLQTFFAPVMVFVLLLLLAVGDIGLLVGMSVIVLDVTVSSFSIRRRWQVNPSPRIAVRRTVARFATRGRSTDPTQSHHLDEATTSTRAGGTPRGQAMTGDRNTFPCPQPGCTAAATTAGADDFAHGDGAPLWQCAAGHHGPTLVDRNT